ncbi:class I SAM-dependent methyltransferase [Paraburkholderia domus]|uniref:2-methoxy-6-polyprenyl-1,4-benzoquinol methylase, mitochondrial n=1 Tax=Paraburkholderia domus TaxID=2793075 RepID=A0A9N8QV10_9BURK|nr:class I SAM-dependent methyltransferase [Paraburkholderia domus]MBK5164783.1 class I SAM-dependent methyltransferase [Burkholderia sp. R-70211]MCI0150451.1 class I SAM-dependent methyltransferase [Paraburkholderia sediminicola]CAE6872815.1 2-methoxy-6-polyprenyl-1,4-benzoquinol methylase, mitochondrial [Paraburkholderia domus]
MTDASKFQFTGSSVPNAYEEFLVPRLFEPWARLLLDEAQLIQAQIVIDVATGPGTVARCAAPMLGPKGRIVATDIARPMLDIARAKPSLPGAAPIEYVESPAAPLLASTGVFDVVLCQQGLQFFPDRPSALREMRRVLKPGGRVVIAVWTAIERNQVFAAIHTALGATTTPELSDLMTAPFSWHSTAELQMAVEEAGFHDVRILTRSLPIVFEQGVEQAMRAFSATPVSPGVAALSQSVQDAFLDRLRSELAPLVVDGKVIGEMVSNIIVAYA